MHFHDIAFLSSRASFTTTFPKSCGGGESLGTCLTSVVVGKVGACSL